MAIRMGPRPSGRVLDFDNVEIGSNVLVSGPAWDAQYDDENTFTGGVLAIRARGEFTLRPGSRISMDGKGFRGGQKGTQRLLDGQTGESGVWMRPLRQTAAAGSGGGGGSKWIAPKDPMSDELRPDGGCGGGQIGHESTDIIRRYIHLYPEVQSRRLDDIDFLGDGDS